jgi:hypothetical protein
MIRKFLKPLAIFMALTMLWEIIFPSVAYALTGGPSQPEMESFEPVGTTDMVDVFTGDFNYNIPLLDVGGYPINIAYHSGVTMDQEASWTGLGWNINAGVVSRTMRGLPDDFNKEEVTTETNVRENITWSLFTSPGFEIFGLSKENKGKVAKGDDSTAFPKDVSKFALSLTMGMTQNNYRGRGYFFGGDFNIPFNSADGKKSNGIKLGFNANSQGGFEYDVSYSRRAKDQPTIGIGTGFNSRSGMKSLVINSSKQKSMHTLHSKDKAQVASDQSYTQGIYNNAIPMAPSADLPTLNQSFNTYAQNYHLTLGAEFTGWHGNIGFGGIMQVTMMMLCTIFHVSVTVH